jgi:O-antigen/teichoic acid export membrane protein
VDETSFPIAKPRHARLIAYKAFADVAGKGSMFVITILAARRLSPESFGVFALGSTLGWMVAVVSDGGIQLHLAREVARQPADAAGLLSGWLRVRIWTAAAVLAVVVFAIAVEWRASTAAPIALLAAVYAGSGLIELLHYFYRGLSRSDIESSLTLWQRSATLALGTIALVWWPSVTVLAIAMLIPVAITLPISLHIAAHLGAEPGPRRHQHTKTHEEDRIFLVRLRALVSSWSQVRPTLAVFRRDVWPIGAGVVLSALYFRIDVFLVQLWAGTEAVASYNAVFRLIEALRLFPAAVLAVVLPALVRAGDLRPLTKVAAPITLFAVVCVAPLWLAAGWLIPLIYGARYASAVPAFRILVLSFPLLSLNYALTHQLVVWNGHRAYAALCAAALVLNVGLNARLIPAASIAGAAWATLGTELFLTAGCGVALWSLRTRLQGFGAAGRVAPSLVMEP